MRTLTGEQAERLCEIVERAAVEYPRQQLPAYARELAERWDLDPVLLAEWILDVARMEALPCASAATAYRVLVAGTRESGIVEEIVSARARALGQVRP